MKTYSSFEAFGQDALNAEELPATVGGIENPDDLRIIEDSEDEVENK